LRDSTASLPAETTVAIVGGGPAGATLGAYLARAGVDHILFERERFPRHHIGESLVGTSNRVFQEIGFLPRLDASGFVEKRAAVWIPKSGRGAFELNVAPDPRWGLDHTFHVDRARFDHLLLDYAAECGTPVHQETRVSEVLVDGDRVTGVVVERDGAPAHTVRARFVIDASGRSTVLGSHFRLKDRDPLFDQYAIYSYFEDFDRGPASMTDHIHIHFLPTRRGWVWQIPISREITSVGVVTERDDFRKDGRDRESYFLRHVQSQPELARRMVPARRIAEFRAEGDYSYSMRRLAGPGWLMIGDAARFVDPIFSSGVSVAVNSARLASQALLSVLNEGAVEADAFGRYEARVSSGIKIWYEFIKIYYKLQNLFTRYVRVPEYREDLIQLLRGDVFDVGQIKVLDRLRDDIRAIERTPNHILQSALTDIPI
jgi:FADH2 O2-dependent halogenase